MTTQMDYNINNSGRPCYNTRCALVENNHKINFYSYVYDRSDNPLIDL